MCELKGGAANLTAPKSVLSFVAGSQIDFMFSKCASIHLLRRTTWPRTTKPLLWFHTVASRFRNQ